MNMWRIFQNHKYLLDTEDYLKKLLAKEELGVFLDYDGTLSAIAETPDMAVMSDEMKKTLMKLSGLSHCHVAIISGRMLTDLKHMVSIPNITYVGNHGFEIENPNNLNFKALITVQYKEALFNIKKNLTSKLAALKGVWIEDKGIILTVHSRQATDSVGRLAKKILMSLCQPYIRNQQIGLMTGKKVMEIRPPIKWDKGEAALWVLSKWQHQWGKRSVGAVYVGDDATDEDAFRMMEGIALTVKVGNPKKSLAHYYLKNQQEVLVLLNRIIALKS